MSDYLPRETLINILTRLPAKTLLRFRCICKSWLSLLSSPDFTSAHLRTAAAKPPLLLLRGYSLTGLTPRYKELYSLRSDDADFTSLLDLHCPFNTNAANFFRVVGSCNGVICLSDDLLGYTYTVILWNPAIRRVIVTGYKDTISIFQYDKRGPYCCKGFTVWVMKEYGVEESWSKLFTGSLNGGVSTILGFRKSGEVVVEKWDGTLVSCQPGKIKKMRIHGGKESFYLGTYAESLILLDEGKCVQMEDNGSSDEVDSAGNASVVQSLEKNSLRHHLFAATALNP
ncbi:hypothetical protein RHSIM_Rhsim07G0052600 [Rhododendron simsii]|uniref:F-box domain-containing protein n=1 Tax=Rhododendron simsii TaxID=118357 RepID=A0A834LLU7_RHOSS|nr:hypothetical protein RHSIM_Rhsim07G0052600 [Rhododendron simsii]